MKRTNALRGVLENLTMVYNEDGMSAIDVEFSDQPHAAQDGSYVAVSPNVRDTFGRSLPRAQELRIICDTLAHEMEHINKSDLESKEEFARKYPEMPKLAGMVSNVVEDIYIDETRMQRYPGMRDSHAFKVKALMDNHHRRPKVTSLDSLPQKLTETMIQISAAGYVKDIGDASPDIREFAGRFRDVVDAVREAAETDAWGPDDRHEAAHETMDILTDYLPDSDEARDEARERMEDDGQAMVDPADIDPEDMDFEPGERPDDADIDIDSDEIEDMMDEMDELPDSDEMPDPDGDGDEIETGDGSGADGDGDSDETVACPECGHTAQVVGGDSDA